MNYQMKIAICDDDEKDRNRTRDMVGEYLDVHNFHIKMDEFASGEEFLAGETGDYGLVIMDIFMQNINGIDTIRRLQQENSIAQVIFCSSSNSYAAESYDVSALRYLLKPVAREKLFAALDRFFAEHTELRTLSYRANRMDERVYLSEILWVEADGHCSVIHTRKGRITTRTTFAKICEELNSPDFVKPIRYALVSLQAVAALPSDVFTLVDGTQVPISRGLRQDMKKAFSDHMMKNMLKKGALGI
jgi:DNA-binding LytR/AlgR family response regulator